MEKDISLKEDYKDKLKKLKDQMEKLETQEPPYKRPEQAKEEKQLNQQ